MATGPDTRPRSWLLPAYGLATVAVIAPQLLGGATGPTALTIYLLSLLVSAWVAWRLYAQRARLGVAPLVALGALAAAVWTLLQALPVPCSWVDWAQPDRAEITKQLAQLGFAAARHCALSAAPGSTWSVLPLATTVVALLLSATVVARAGHRDVLVRSIAVSSILMACVALGHWVLNEPRVFGLYQPIYVHPRLLVAPLLNENHLAGHLALGFPVCLALALSSRRVDSTIVWTTGAMLVFSTGLLALSRGGAGALLLGGGACVLTYVARKRSERRQTVLVAASVVVTCVLVGAYAGYARIAEEFAGSEASLSDTKLRLIVTLFPLALRHPWAGVGRGALGDVSAQVLEANARALYTENLPSQWLIEWGFPCTLLLLAASAASVWRWSWGRARGPELGLACGLAALIIQNLVDFSLEMAGIACTAAIACGTLTARERPLLRRPRVPVAPLAGAAALLALISVVAGVPWLTYLRKDSLRARIEQQLIQDPKAAHAALDSAFAGYPIDPTFVLLGATAASASADAKTGRWLNLALRVAPGWAGPHLLAAAALERRGALRQAAGELSMAAAREPWPATEHACSFVRRHPSASLARDAANENPAHRQKSLEQLTLCLPYQKDYREGELLLELALAEYPQSTMVHQQYVAAARARGNHDLSIERARSMGRLCPQSPEALVALGEALLAGARPREALALIEGAPPALRTRRAVMTLEAQTVLALALPARFDSVIENMLSTHGRTAQDRASVHELAVQGLHARGNYLGALAHAQSAYDLTQDPSLLELVHRSALDAGLTAVALRTASELCQVRHRAEIYCGRTGSPAK